MVEVTEAKKLYIYMIYFLKWNELLKLTSNHCLQLKQVLNVNHCFRGSGVHTN